MIDIYSISVLKSLVYNFVYNISTKKMNYFFQRCRILNDFSYFLFDFDKALNIDQFPGLNKINLVVNMKLDIALELTFS